MKNVLSIDMLRNCEVDLLANVSEDDNSLILKSAGGSGKWTKSTIGNEIIEISGRRHRNTSWNLICILVWRI